ncbi:Hypothetical predicted protein [Paramuricea clavata]|uniref:Uncharacterized protein n=1 Tax=Paramuricea clavata TaxID=317549 RepID=A0A7D9L679_PARCT|nr:Hypothetical predicted protein [Paramuricea clavata]
MPSSDWKKTGVKIFFTSTGGFSSLPGGDLNCNLLQQNIDGLSLLNFASELNLKQLIASPTRITESSESLIDVVMSSTPDLVQESGVIETSISDHFSVYMQTSFPNTRHNSEVNSKLSILNDALLSTLQTHAPVKTIRVRNRPCPYIPQNIKDLMAHRDQLHRQFKFSRDVGDWTTYKNARQSVKIALKNAEKEYVRGEVLAHKNNTTSLWKIINRCIPSKERKCYSKDSEQIANEFNQFFIAVGEKTANAAAQVALDNLNGPISSSFPAISPAQTTHEMFHLTLRVRILNELPCLCLQTKHQDRTKLV